MSKINDLIKKLCPNGVEYDSLENVALLQAGDRITTAMMSDDYNYDVIGGGTSPTGKYNDYNREHCITISRAGSAGFVNWIEDKFWATDVCFTASQNNDYMNIKFIYHYLKNSQKEFKQHLYGGSMPKLEKPFLWKYPIPIPPLEVQEEIVRILDKFGELEAELEAEIEARKSQYEFWRGKLFDFDENVNELSLEELCNIVDYRGKTPKKVDSGIFLVTAKNIKMGYIDYEYSKEYIAESDFDDVMRRGKANIGDVLFTTEAPCGHVAQVDKDNIALAQRVIKYSSKDLSKLSNKYLKYALLSNQFQNKLLETSTGATVKGIKGSKLHKMTIPVPSIEIQNHIVNILERFDKLINDITDGLPAEIELRRQQYEYYRNMLLNFEEVHE